MRKNSNYYENYNFLNIINRRVGKLYKVSGYSPLPAGFVVDESKVQDVLTFGQMKDIYVMPPFINEDAKTMKKHFKIALKNCKHIIKYRPFEDYVSEDFAEKLTVYFNIRKDLTDILLKELKKSEADEVKIYQEIYNLNPVLGSLLDELFENKVNFDELFENLEVDYHIVFADKLKLIDKKKSKKKQKNDLQIESEIVVQNSKIEQKERKIIEKTAKNAQKLEKEQEIEKVKAEKQQAKKENKEK